MDELKKQAEELGIKVDGRWSAERLQAEIDKKLAEEPEPEGAAQPDVEPVVVEPAPVVEPKAVTDPVEPEVSAGVAAAFGDPIISPVTEPEFDPVAKAAADAEIEAEIQARFDASQDDGSVVIINLQANPMKVLGLASYGEATLTAAQLADPRFYAKVERAKTLGLIKVK